MRGRMGAETEGNFSEKAGYRVMKHWSFINGDQSRFFKEIREIIGDTLPPDLLASFGLSIGDVLTIEKIDGTIVLTPKLSDSDIP